MKKAIYVTIALLALLSVSLVAAQISGLPGLAWEAASQVQNVGSGPANIVYTAYGQDGTSYNCGTSTGVAVGASINVQTADCPVAAGFIGSAVVSADQQIAAIVNVNNRTVGTAAGQYKGTDGNSTDTTVSFPLVKADFAGRTTTFYVQNAGASAADITATFSTGPLGGTPTTRSHTYTNVPANAMVIVSAADASVPAGQLGSLTVTSANALAGTSLEHETTATTGANLQASRGFTSADSDTTAYCPLYRKNHTGNLFSTGVQVQNVGNASTDVTFTFGSYSDTQAVGAGASYTFFSNSISGIADGSVGSATVTSNGQPIVAVVNDRGFALNPSRLTTYACFPASSATNDVTIPLYKEFFGGNTSGLQVQNVGSGAATINVTYTPDPNFFPSLSPVTFQVTGVGANTSATFFGVSQLISPAGVSATSGTASTLNNTFGGVTISANQPIVVIANESSFALSGAASGQDNKNYEGFNQ